MILCVLFSHLEPPCSGHFRYKSTDEFPYVLPYGIYGKYYFHNMIFFRNLSNCEQATTVTKKWNGGSPLIF